MKRGTLLFEISLVMLLALAACGDDSPPSAGSTPTPSPTSTTFEEAEWTIVTPAGWTKEDVTSDADAKRAIRYKGATGEYFIVAIDPTGSDFSSDAVWRYEVKGTGFEVVEKVDCTGGADQQCSTTDARYDAWVLAKSSGTPPTVGGHTWYFIFGDTDSTTIDQAVFEQLVESVTVKS